MSEIKHAITVFHYIEKTKSNLIIAFNLLEALNNMRDEEIVGAEKLLVAYFNGLIREVNIAANASGVSSFKEVNAKLEQAVEHINQHNYANAMKLVSEAISITTTHGSKAAKTLEERNLI